MLQPVVQKQPSYFKDSFTLKNNMEQLCLPRGALLFTCDATSMYTNIPTDIALQAISKYLSANENIIFHHYDSNALIEALQIIFNNNFIQFGDT